MRLRSRTAIVAGTGRSLGKGIASKLAAEDAKVIVANTSMETVSTTTEEISASGGTVKASAAGITKRDEVKVMTDFTVESLGTLGVIVNNVGINRDVILHKMTVRQWDQATAINLTGTFYCVQYAVQITGEKGSGAIIGISSAGWLGDIGQVNHAASETGAVGLTKTACRELTRKGVTYNTVCLGLIDTDMTHGVPEKVWDTMISRTPTGGAGSPASVVSVVAFLASDEANYITGEVINVGDDTIL